MKFTIKKHQVVYFYDEPLVATAQQDDSFFISFAVPGELWLSCRVTKDNFNGFMSGQKDLLSIVEDKSTSFGTFTTDFFEESAEYVVHPVVRENLLPQWLPGPGFKLQLQVP